MEFILLVDGEEHSRHTANLQGAAFTWVAVAPKIDDAKVKQWPYELKYQIEHGGDTHDGVESWMVWPKTLELAPQGNDTPVQLKLLQQDKPIKAPPKVEKDKTAKATLQRPEAFTIQAAFPWKVNNGETQSGQGRKIPVDLERIPFQVKFVLLDDGDDAGSPVKQLVNVKSAGDKGTMGLDHKGPEIALHFKVKGIDKDQYAEAAGTLVYVRATFDDKTKRDDPKFPRKLGADGVKVAGDVHTGTVKLDKDGFATCRLHLPLAGGETCKVELGTTDQYGDAEKHFVTWRQLHFQISHPASLTKPDPADFVTSYDEVKVEMVEETTGAIADDSGPKGSWIDGDEVQSGFGRKALVIGTHNEKTFHKSSFKNKNDAKYAHFLICDFQFDAGKVAGREFKLEDKHLIGGSTLSFLIGDILANDSLAALPTSIKDGKPALRKLAWRIPSKNKKGEIAVADCTLDYANNQDDIGKLECTLPGDAITAQQANEAVYINFLVQLAVGPYNGSSTKNLLLIAAYNPAARPEDKMNQTMVHEIGHALGMCADEITIPGIADVKVEHGRSYKGRGHSGGHCAKGVADADYDDPTVSLSGKPGTCVMFGEGGDDRLRSYCDLCQKLLLPAALQNYFLESL